MKRSIKALLIATTLVGGAAAAVAYAMPPGGGACGYGPHAMGLGRHGMDHEARIERMAQHLNLTQEQREQVRAIVDKHRPQTRALRDQLTESHKQLREIVRSDRFNENEVRKLAEAQGKLKAEMIVQRAKVQNEIRAVLTEEQRRQLDEMRKQRHEHRRG